MKGDVLARKFGGNAAPRWAEDLKGRHFTSSLAKLAQEALWTCAFCDVPVTIQFGCDGFCIKEVAFKHYGNRRSCAVRCRRCGYVLPLESGLSPYPLRCPGCGRETSWLNWEVDHFAAPGKPLNRQAETISGSSGS